jgi:hypothetical protein
VSSCETEIRSLEKFNAIDLRNSANIIITEGDIQEVKIEGEDNSNITTVINNGKLIIDSKTQKTQSVNIFITVKNLCNIENAGSGDITTNNHLTCENLVMRVSGSGDVNASIDSKSIKLVVSGSGNMKTKGRAAEANLKITGSGNINGKDLQTFTTSVNITGTGTSTVDVNNELNVSIKGSGNVYYISDPERIYSIINGSGKIEKLKA